MRPKAINFSVLFLVACILCGCTPGKHSFLIVQTCLGDARNLADFMALMRSVAQSEHMNFVDGSVQGKKDLEAMGAWRQKDPYIFFRVDQSDGIGLTGSNLGLPGYQVAVGFGEGSNSSFARAFADRVIARLNAHWKVETVPSSKGALPLKNCPKP